MDRQALIKQLMATYLQELDEHVQVLNRDLLALERAVVEGVPSAQLQTILRTVHSLKGASRSVNVGLIESSCHHLEGIFAALQSARSSPSPELMSLLFQAADGIEEAGMRLREQHDLQDSPLATVLLRLEAASLALRTSPPSSSSPAPPVSRPELIGEADGGQTKPSQPAPVGLEKGKPPPAEAAPAESAVSVSTVRILVDKLDALLASSGEVAVARWRLESTLRELVGLGEHITRALVACRALRRGLLGPSRPDNQRRGVAPRRTFPTLSVTEETMQRLEREFNRLCSDVTQSGRELHQSAVALDEHIRRARMHPFADACQGLDRSVRDLSEGTGKEVDFSLDGGEVELDRSVLEGLKDPLRHLVRNAVAHGAETVPERLRAAKPRRARVTVTAAVRGPLLEITVADDGRGLDLEALREQARLRNLPAPNSPEEFADLIFQPGLSTAPVVTDISGRGVGLDVVKSRVEALRGIAEVSSSPGIGTRFMLSVPLTLSTLRAILVNADGKTFALGTSSIHQLVSVAPDAFRSVEGHAMLSLGGAPVPVASLARVLGLPQREAPGAPSKIHAMVVTAGNRRVALVVDEFLTEHEVMVKSLEPRIRHVRHITGATILPSGKVALVLNPLELVATALGGRQGRVVPPSRDTERVVKRRILLAEDSVTTRTLEKTILESAGYEVVAVPDGAEAWKVLQERGADLLVSDVEMPGLDGFALTEAVRGSQRFARLPVVLVTSREREEDRVRGVEIGADAYLVKSAFDQQKLLETIAQLL